MFQYRLVQLISSTLCHKDIPQGDEGYKQFVTDQSEIKIPSSIISALFVLEALRTYSSAFFDEDVEILKVGGM